MIKILSFLLTIFLVLVLIGCFLYLIGSPLRIIGPFKIIGGDPGRLHDGEYVWGLKKQFLTRDLRNGDVIIFNQPYMENGQQVFPSSPMGDTIAEIVALPRGQMDGNVYDFFDNELENKPVMEGYFLIEKGNKGVYRLLPQSAVTDVIVWP